MLPYSRPKFSDFYTPYQVKLLKNPTLHSGTYLYYTLYMGVPPPPWGMWPNVYGLCTHWTLYQTLMVQTLEGALFKQQQECTFLSRNYQLIVATVEI